MSLQLAAQHLASRGRGPDTTLVHMAPQEVAGLQALAKAHGGSLTVNPDTGLAEAGFLSSILPMVAGAALAATGIGAPLAAGIVGAGYGVATGSLQKGLMAGLGAYGGAGLAGGLMGAGAAGAAEAGAAGLGASGAAASEMAATQAALQQNALAGIGVDSAAAAGTGSMSFAPGMTTNVLGTAPIAGPMSVPVSTGQLAAGVPLVATATPMPVAAPTFSDNVSQMFQGAKNLGTEAGREAFMSKAGVGGLGGLAKYGLAGLAPVAMDMMTPKQRAIAEQEKLKPYKYDFAYNPTGAASTYAPSGYDSSERMHFNPAYTRTAAGGGLMDIGPVEAMSRSNQSQMAPAYAQGGVSDMAVDPYTGAETFAEGGATEAVRKVEDDPYYSMTGMSGDVYKYLQGQGRAPVTPVPAPTAVVVPVQSTVQPMAVAAEPASPFGRLFGGLLGKSAAQNQGGEYVDADTNIKPYSFDPVTGAFTSVAPKKVFRPYTPEPEPTTTSWDGGGGFAQGGIASLAQGGQSHLGDYSDGGRLLRGPGDGVSDSIPASIGDKRPARLADGEFVVPARIVSELGNGSTEAGARKLYAMMDRVQKARKKSIGKDRVAVNSRAEKLLPV